MAADILLQEKSKALLQSLKNKQQKLHAIVQPYGKENHPIASEQEQNPFKNRSLQAQNHELIGEARRKLLSRNMERILSSTQNERSGETPSRSPIESHMNGNDVGETYEKVQMFHDPRFRDLTESPSPNPCFGETKPKSNTNQYTEKVQTMDKTTPKSFTVSSECIRKNKLPERLSRRDPDSHAILPHFVESPNTIRRKIIDKNIHIGNNLENECLTPEKLNSKRLNFSYSRYNETDYDFVQDRLDNSPKIRQGQDRSVPTVGEEVFGRGPRSGAKESSEDCQYEDNLRDPGNSRKIASFITDATTKSKSVVFSKPTGNQSMSRVVLLTHQDSSIRSLPFESKRMQTLLGYDWIAGLLDNSSGAMDMSEAHFEELRDFRRVNRDECVNQFYMEAPASLEELKQREPGPVAEALEITKVKPYTVNERLFTVPLKKTVQGDVIDQTERSQTTEPTAEDPRFVRVSIPRSSLMSPHRVKPHRRRSFDPTDTCSLTEHCLLGWQNSCPSMMPSASHVGLKNATHGIKSQISTTLADAEKIASFHPYPWPTNGDYLSRPNPSTQMSDMHKTTLDSTLAAGMTSLPVSSDSQSIKRATDDLLNSTYSLMYELEKLKTERKLRGVQ
ncbi:hypothetical protein ScPMuIL_009724 [Solemya velum]